MIEIYYVQSKYGIPQDRVELVRLEEAFFENGANWGKAGRIKEKDDRHKQ